MFVPERLPFRANFIYTNDGFAFIPRTRPCLSKAVLSVGKLETSALISEGAIYAFAAQGVYPD